ncbi:hypothetical protein MYXO_00139 [Myxococcaceae bacterium]|nr:hypothetical protein MYXO_00139 [Myxococcaceae bacterium]
MSRARRFAASLLVSAFALGVPDRPAQAQAKEDSAAADSHLTGADIYRRVVDNRFRSLMQELTLTSGDRGRNEQTTVLELTWQDVRDDEGRAVDGYYSKTRIVYTDPFDVRYTAYLVLQKEVPPNDQFVYLPSRRKIRRVNLRNETVFGTDFSFEDVIPREFESATYRRLPDEACEALRCFVVEATPKPDQNSEYSKLVLSVEKARSVPIRIRYWSTSGVEVKELVSPVDSIREFEGVFLPMQATMRNLVQETYTVATVDRVVPNPELARTTFDPRKLEGH